LKCGKRGHIAKECWTKDPKKKDEEAGKRKNEGEVGAAGIDKDVQDYLLNTVDDEGVKDTDQLIGTDDGIMDADQFTDTDSGMDDTDQWIDVQEYLLSTADDGCINDTDLWIADTRAMVHMTPFLNKLSSVKSQGLDIITMGNGSQEKVEVIGNVIGAVRGDKGEEKIKIQGVTYLKNGRFNLFSISQMLKKGWSMVGAEKITIKKDGFKIDFNVRVKTSKGMLYGVQIVNNSAGLKMTVMEAHYKRGHQGMQAVKNVANSLGWMLTGKEDVCKACAEGKARQKSIMVKNKKFTTNVNTGRFHLDKSSVRKDAAKPYWQILVDEATQMRFSDFFPSKNSMIEPTCKMLSKWVKSGKAIMIIRCNDAGLTLWKRGLRVLNGN
jgi:hypothetical protein